MSNPPNQYSQHYFPGASIFPPTPPATDESQSNSFKNEANSCVAGVHFVWSTPAPPIPFIHSPNIGHSPIPHSGTFPGMHTIAAVTTQNTSAQNFPQGSFLSPTVQDDTPEITPLAMAPFPWDWVRPHLWEKGHNAVKIGRGPNDTKVFKVYSLHVFSKLQVMDPRTCKV